MDIATCCTGSDSDAVTLHDPPERCHICLVSRYRITVMNSHAPITLLCVHPRALLLGHGESRAPPASPSRSDRGEEARHPQAFLEGPPEGRKRWGSNPYPMSLSCSAP